MKIEIDGLYDSFESKEMREAFEEALVRRIREKFRFLRHRVDMFIDCGSFYEKILSGEVIPANLESPEAQKLIDRASESEIAFAQFADEDKTEWEAFIAILWTAIGPDQIPVDDEPINVEILESILQDYQIKWARREELTDAPNADGNQNTDAKSAKRGRGRPAKKRAIVVAHMQQAIAKGRCTLDDLKNSKLDALAIEHGCSRTTIRAALKDIDGHGGGADT